MLAGSGQIVHRQQPGILQPQALVVGVFVQRGFQSGEGFRVILLDQKLGLQQYGLVLVGLQFENGVQFIFGRPVLLVLRQNQRLGQSQLDIVRVVRRQAVQAADQLRLLLWAQVFEVTQQDGELGEATLLQDHGQVRQGLERAPLAHQQGGPRVDGLHVVRFQFYPKLD